MSGHQHLRVFNDENYNIACTIRQFRHFYGIYSPCEDIIHVICVFFSSPMLVCETTTTTTTTIIIIIIITIP